MNARGCLLSVGTSRWRDKRKDNCGECYYKLGQFYRRRVACHYPNLMELFPKTVWCSSETMFLELEEYGLLWKFNLREPPEFPWRNEPRTGIFSCFGCRVKPIKTRGLVLRRSQRDNCSRWSPGLKQAIMAQINATQKSVFLKEGNTHSYH